LSQVTTLDSTSKFSTFRIQEPVYISYSAGSVSYLYMQSYILEGVTFLVSESHAGGYIIIYGKGKCLPISVITSQFYENRESKVTHTHTEKSTGIALKAFTTTVTNLNVLSSKLYFC
jgi:hypothetical protein